MKSPIEKICLTEWQALAEPIAQDTNACPTDIHQTLARDMQRRKIVVPVFAAQKMHGA
ncbi:MAG: hypothetical protein OSB20_03110 [Porticoccaceae bacterium]|nr:hypothetical protein [Porticoccaceae bacterium]